MEYKWSPPSKNQKPLWEGKLIEKFPLKNGLVLEIWNYSRKIAGDRWLVGFLAQVGVEPEKHHFSSEFYYQKFLEKTDGKVYYRYRKERTFVPEKEVEKLFNSLKENFLSVVLPYLEKEEFKKNLITQEVKIFENKINWEIELEKREKEMEKLEEEWKDRTVF